MERQTDFKDDFNDEDKVENKFWKPEKDGDSVLGYLKAIEDGTFGKQYHISTNDGDIIIGSYAFLTSKIEPSMIGSKLKVVYLGEKKAERTGRAYKDFDVFVK